MTEFPEEMVRCPNCRRENLAQATRCVYCGNDLDSFDLGELTPADAGTDEEQLNVAPLPPYEIDPDAPIDGDILEGYAPESAVEGREDEQIPDDAPEWLKRIRERAENEADARGIYASEPPVEPENDGAAQFEAWKREQEQARERAEAARKHALPRRQDGTPNWLKRVRDLQTSPEDDILASYEGSLQPEKDQREFWTEEELEALREATLGLGEGGEPDQPIEPEEAPQPDLGEVDESDPQQETPEDFPEGLQELQLDQPTVVEPLEEPKDALIEPSILTLTETTDQPIETIEGQEQAEGSEQENLAEDAIAPAPEITAAAPTAPEPDLIQLRNQRERAELLRELVAQEGQAAKPRHQSGVPDRSSRGLPGFLLLIIVIMGFTLIPPGPGVSQTLSAGALAFDSSLQALGDGQRLLVLVDYQAATEPELELPAASILRQRAPGNTFFATAQFNGTWLARALLAAAEYPEETQVVFLPGGPLGMFHEALTGKEMTGGSSIHADLPALHTISAILLVSDSADSVRAWLEQIGPSMPATQFLALTTQSEKPLLEPYFDSGQLAGLISSADVPGEDNERSAHARRAFEVGILAMVIFVLLGVITKIEADLGRRQGQEQA